MNKCPRCATCFEGNTFSCPQCHFAPAHEDRIECFALDFDQASTGFPPDAFDRLYDVEENSFWFQARNKLILWAMNRYFPNAENFMEIGCGTGFVLNAVANQRPGMNVVGTELFLSGLRFARKRLGDRARMIQMDARKIPFDAEFDVVGAFDVLEHIEKDEDVLVQMRNAVKPGGGVIITVPQHVWLWSSLDVIAKHERRYSKGELVEKMEKAGLKCIYATSFVSLPVPLMLASRLRKMDLNKAQAELSLPWILDRIIRGVMLLERTAIRCGLRFPVGGSLLVVGRRK